MAAKGLVRRSGCLHFVFQFRLRNDNCACTLEDAHADGSPKESIFAGERVTCLLVGHHCHNSVIEIATEHASPDRPPLLFRILRIESQLMPQSRIGTFRVEDECDKDR
ncbi:hypothetical protein NPIL_383321 [Nephila pilipes]|uniref:Uncharacterized protein n=1 Tax=Nephila pilipes TaxID=299642 RepID=A0A8X6Q7E7_NEPPI|nr:hypothetical protein NPIL_383321 [Nephila pilipes]